MTDTMTNKNQQEGETRRTHDPQEGETRRETKGNRTEGVVRTNGLNSKPKHCAPTKLDK